MFDINHIIFRKVELAIVGWLVLTYSPKFLRMLLFAVLITLLPWQVRHWLYFQKIWKFWIFFLKKIIWEGNIEYFRIFCLLKWKFQNQLIIQQTCVKTAKAVLHRVQMSRRYSPLLFIRWAVSPPPQFCFYGIKVRCCWTH